MFQTGYILSRRADLFWFLGLPFFGIAVALISQQWLPAVALVAVNIWITVPHHFATWVRTYGLHEEFLRWKDRFIIGPLFILGMALLGLKWAPLSTAMLVILWDHQHSVMQQHGFARIYDFKAGTGAPSTRNFDLALNWVLYINLLLTAPLFAQVWLRWLYRWDLPISASAVQTLQSASWIATAVFAGLYLIHVIWCLRRGYPLNPVKYYFIGASYFLWYFTAWHTASWLVYGIAHRLMHGLQYIVIAYVYFHRKAERTQEPIGIWAKLIRPRNIKAFVFLSIVYAFLFQIITLQPLDAFGFGVVNFTKGHGDIPELGLGGFGYRAGYDLFAVALMNTAALTHYYFDSFIWKVREEKTQEGL